MRRIAAIAVVIVLGVVLAAACQKSGGDPESGADAGADQPDADPAPGGPDGGTQEVSCSSVRQLATYPWGVPGGTYFGTGPNAPPNDVTIGVLADDFSPSSHLTVEVWFGSGVQAPAQRMFRPGDSYFTCDVCLTMSEGCSGGPCKTTFFAQGGQLQLGRAVPNANVGGIRANAQNLLLVEWSLDQDRPIHGGRCVQISTVNMDVDWGSVAECSGDFCSSGSSCCEGAPYCTNGTGGPTRFCSGLCGASGDGCGGADACCDGFKCFLGTCISDSCAGDSCTTGMDGGGGCCGAAPYCTSDSKCRPTCGDPGSMCGTSGDCCAGLTCQAGTCT